MTVRSWLYVPGDRPGRFAKAAATGAGAVVLDLEDAVPPAGKDDARAAVVDWLAGPRADVQVWVRVGTGQRGADDVAAVARGARLTGVVLPKASSRALLERVHDQLLAAEDATGRAPCSIGVSPLVESAAGVLAAPALAGGPRVRCLQLGEVDLAADLGVTPGPDGAELLLARSSVVLASAAAGITPPPAAVSTEFRDLAAFEAQTRRMVALGFRGRACIHPAQVEVVERVCRPTPEEVAAARDVLARLDASPGVAVGADGRLLDEAVARQARATLGLA
ncbi:HpcH/HpaI aldolase/citrate lyase family protein [Klenkia brasiliensis]|uniref:Citrate lyase subunit beta / citryl-CoA lyase n=1 Tax=Klenkia brasiliensis TaxID=333142 RepID=A0A1G7PVI6_9ACTN|nr:CoA ester lyase [Klenkia brasiliensis]SDF90268.1 citrate lyase subunit beta / citryl-CoA lyase [Klenkia brasiliensis]